MLTTYDTIYLSPHLDDVALSCGGQVFAQTTSGKSVLIVTMMAGDPPTAAISDFARSLHRRWNLERDVVSKRRQEDIAACQILGADYVHWRLADCIYRYHPESGIPLYDSIEALFGSVHAAEFSLIAELAQRISHLPRSSRIVAPLAIGHHVDHQITRKAVEASAREGISYYEDYPYVREPGALEAALPDTTNWRPQIIKLSDADLRAKVASVAAFASQLTSFFSDRADMAKQIETQAGRTGGERLWNRITIKPVT